MNLRKLMYSTKCNILLSAVMPITTCKHGLIHILFMIYKNCEPIMLYNGLAESPKGTETSTVIGKNTANLNAYIHE